MKGHAMQPYIHSTPNCELHRDIVGAGATKQADEVQDHGVRRGIGKSGSSRALEAIDSHRG